jgi:cytochrome c-type biogenesis protein CcmH/NrfG
LPNINTPFWAKIEAYCNIGIAYASSNKFKKAIEAYEKAIEIKPDKDEAYYGIGVAYTSSLYCNKPHN